MGQHTRTQVVPPTITPMNGWLSLGQIIAISEASTTGNAVWPTANLAIFIPLSIPDDVLVVKFSLLNGIVASGNYDFGLYDSQGNLVVSTGSTAITGTSVIQTIDSTDTLLPRGFYYLGMAVDNITANFSRMAPSAAGLNGWGVRQMASAFPLPATITLAAPANAYLPYNIMVHTKAASTV